MNAFRGARPAARAARPRLPGLLAAALLAAPVLGGCDAPFEPYEENSAAPFSMFGYLDLKADTQWVRVMPVRQGLLVEPVPIDAVVTLENLGTGRTTTLRDSLFTFADPTLGGVAYTFNFWTTERLEPGARYRLRAVRSDGASSSALVEMPAVAEFAMTYAEGPPDGLRDPDPFRFPLLIDVRGDRVLYNELVYLMWNLAEAAPAATIAERQTPVDTAGGVRRYIVPGSGLTRPGLFDMRRMQARVAVVRTDWPFRPGLSATEVALPGVGPSNVENGFGFVGGVATWTVPLARCNPVQPRPNGQPACSFVLTDRSTSVVGQVVGACRPTTGLPVVRLTQRFPGGGFAILDWRAGWDGTYSFQGLEPGTELFLEVFGSGTYRAVEIPRLAAGERFVAPEISVPTGC